MTVLGHKNPCNLFQGELEQNCTKKACKECGPGCGAVGECNGSTQAVCEPCVAGLTFSSSTDPCSKCEPVDECILNAVIDIPATPEHNLKCKCKDGYHDVDDYCDPIPSPKSNPLHNSDMTVLPTSSVKSSLFQVTVTADASSPATESAAASQTRYVAWPSGVGTVSALRATPVPYVMQPPLTGRPTFDSRSSPTHSSLEMTSKIYVVVGVCTVVALITAVVVGVACYCYRRRLRRGTGCHRPRDDDEIYLSGERNDYHGE